MIRLFVALLAPLFVFVATPAHAGGDLKRGEEVFRQCSACHTIKKGEKHKLGPNLYGVFGSIAGTAEGYAYSKSMKEYGKRWCQDGLDTFLNNPKDKVPGTKMPSRFPKAEDREAIIAYLKENSLNFSKCE